MQEDYQKKKIRLLQILKDNAFFREKVTLSSGKKSGYYIDARKVTLSPEGVWLCARLILDLIKDKSFDAIGGPTLGADSLAGAIAALSFEIQRPVNTFIIRKAPKPYGRQRQIEGPVLKENARVILIDDVVTTGKSFLQSMDVLKQIGAEIVEALCIVDRQEGAQEALSQRDCRLTSLFTSSDFLK